MGLSSGRACSLKVPSSTYVTKAQAANFDRVLSGNVRILEYYYCWPNAHYISSINIFESQGSFILSYKTAHTLGRIPQPISSKTRRHKHNENAPHVHSPHALSRKSACKLVWLWIILRNTLTGTFGCIVSCFLVPGTKPKSRPARTFRSSARAQALYQVYPKLTSVELKTRTHRHKAPDHMLTSYTR